MLDVISKIIELSRARITALRKDPEKWYEGSDTHYEGLLDEIQEARDEMRENNNIHLEDELGDVFWDYMCLLHGLEQEGKIDLEKVFERCYGKLSERLREDATSSKERWQEVKKIQKEKLANEHLLRFGSSD